MLGSGTGCSSAGVRSGVDKINSRYLRIATTTPVKSAHIAILYSAHIRPEYTPKIIISQAGGAYHEHNIVPTTYAHF